MPALGASMKPLDGLVTVSGTDGWLDAGDTALNVVDRQNS
jgi:hypothetical protein